MITILSGGTGTPKLIQGMIKIIPPKEINVVVNTVDNTYVSGIYVAADIVTVMYTFAGIINEDTWYGIADDTFVTHETLKKFGYNEILKIGDKDRATKIQKTMLMRNYSLSKAVDIQRKRLGIESQIIPMSDEESYIKILTDEGEMDFHEFLVEKKGKPRVFDVIYNHTNPSDGVIESIETSDMVLVGPSNPITSIGPIISTKGVLNALKNAYVVAVSPIIGRKPVSGPAAKFMRALGYDISCLGVATIYSKFADKFIIDLVDAKYKKKIEKLISEVVVTNTNMKTIEDKVMLAKTILGEAV